MFEKFAPITQQLWQHKNNFPKHALGTLLVVRKTPSVQSLEQKEPAKPLALPAWIQIQETTKQTMFSELGSPGVGILDNPCWYFASIVKHPNCHKTQNASRNSN